MWEFPNKKIIMQLKDDNHLKIEVKDGKCNNSEIFTNPFNYER